MKRFIRWIAALAMLSAPSLVAAQVVVPQPAPPGHTVLYENGRRIYRSDEIIPITAPVSRPYSFALTGRSPLGYTALEDRKSYVSEVVAVVRREPF
jgi:hypothetical protein